MNIDQFTQIQPSWRNTTLIDTTNPEKFTISNSKIVDSGANQAWSLVNFFEIAMPLMVGTILVPLVIGSFIRAFLQALGRGRTWWRLLFAFFVVWSVTITLKSFGVPIANGCCHSYSIVTAMGLPGGIFMSVGMSIPFYFFVGLNFTLFFRGKKKNWICLIYWMLSLCWLLVSTTVMDETIGSAIMGAIYGISLFVVMWLRPDFYYRWDQGRRTKVKEI